MADFKKLSEVDLTEEVSDTANVLIEEGGIIKRAPKTKVGGAGTDSVIKTAIITSSNYDSHISEVSTYVGAAPVTTYSCKNMTFEEAYEALTTGTPIDIKFLDYKNSSIMQDVVLISVPANNSVIGISCVEIGLSLYWTSSGISTTAPTVS